MTRHWLAVGSFCGALLLLGLVALPGLAQEAPAASVTNRATVRYADRGGTRFVAHSPEVVTALAPAVRLAITIAASRNPVAPADTLAWTITVTNLSPWLPAERVTVTAELEGRLRIVDALDGVWRKQVDWATPFELPPRGTWTRVIVTVVDADVPLGSTFAARAEARAANAAEAAVAAAACVADIAPALTLSKRAERSALLGGEQFTYALTYANTGSAPADNVSLVDDLPPGLRFVRAVPAPQVDGQLLTWPLGRLEVGQGGTIALTVVAAPAGAGTQIVRNALTGQGTAIGAVSVWDTVYVHASEVQTDAIRLVKQALLAGDSLAVGEVITYRLIVANTGLRAVSVVLRDTLDAVLEPLEVAASSGQATLAGQVASVAYAELAAGAADTVLLRARLRQVVPLPLSVANQAWVAGEQGQPAVARVQTPLRRLGRDAVLEQTAQIVAGQPVELLVWDADASAAAGGSGRVAVTVANLRTGETESVLLEESEPGSGRFAGVLNTYYGEIAGAAGDGVLDARGEDVLVGTYLEPLAADGAPRPRTAQTRVLGTAIGLQVMPRTIVANGADQSLLTARVTDALGRPLPDGTLVEFSADQGTFANGTGRIALPVAGGDGQAMAVFTAPVLTQRSTAHVAATFRGYDSDTIELEVLPGAVAVRVFDAERGIEVRGADPELRVVLRLTGTTAVGEPVEVSVETDENGVFVVPEIPPGTYDLKATVSDRRTGRVVSDGVLQRIVVNFDGSTTPPTDAVSGQVRARAEANGARYAGTEVELVDGSGQVVATTTLDAEGRYDFQRVPPGRYQVRVTLADGRSYARAVDLRSQTAGAVLVNVNVLIDPFGIVFDASTGTPVTGATVALEHAGGALVALPSLAGAGAPPNVNNANPWATTAAGGYAFLFAGEQVGSLEAPAEYVLTVTPPPGSAYLPRRIALRVAPSRAGPVGQVPITMQARAADGSELAQPNSLVLVAGPVVVSDIEVVALNVPLFTRAPVLAFSKIATPALLAADAPVDFALLVANAGNDTARAVSVVDTLSASWQLLATDPRGSQPAAGVARWSLGDLAPGQRDTLRLSARVLPPQADGARVDNTAWLHVAGRPSVQASAAVAVQGALELHKWAALDSLHPGQLVRYTLAYQNRSLAAVAGAALIDSLPPGLRLVEAPGGTVDDAVVVWALPEVPAGGAGAVTVTARALDTLRVGATVTNRALLRSASGAAMATAAAALPVRLPAVTLSKAAAVDSVEVGEDVTFTLVVANPDTVALPGPIALVDSLPPAMAVQAHSGSPAVTAAAVSWVLPGLDAGQTDTLSVVLRPARAGPATNRAFLRLHDRELAASAPLVVTPPPALRVHKRAGAAAVNAGEQVSYTLEVTAGAADVTGVALADTLPPSLAYVPGSAAPPAQYDTLARALRWELGSVPAGTARSVQFAATPAPTLAPGEHRVANTAVASAAGAVFRSAAAQVAVTVPYFRIAKTTSASVVEVGDLLDYTIRLRNDSAADSLADLRIEDTLPFGFDFVTGSARFGGARTDPDTATARQLVWHLPGLGAGRAVDLSYRLVVGTGAAHGDQTNRALATAVTAAGRTVAAAPAQARVRLRPDLFARGEVVLGRAWVDEDGDGLQDGGEPPVPGVVLVMEDGTRVIADEQGRFSVPEVRPGDHVLRLLDTHLPAGLAPVPLGARSAGDPWIRFVTLASGGMGKANFPFRRVASLRKTVSMPGAADPTARPAQVWSGATLRYELRAVGAAGSLVTDVLPGHTTLVRTDAAAAVHGDTVRWELPAQAPGDTAVLWLELQVDPEWHGALRNRAAVWAPPAAAGVAAAGGAGATGQPLAVASDSVQIEVLPRPVWQVVARVSPDTLVLAGSAAQWVPLVSPVLFPTARATFGQPYRSALAALAQRLAVSPPELVRVAGHADARPIATRRFPDNEVLSLARAHAVKDFLVAGGVDSARIVAVGFGARRPVAPNTPAGWARNRRVEIEGPAASAFAAAAICTTRAVFSGPQPLPWVELADSLAGGVAWREHLAGPAPTVDGSTLRWSWPAVAPGDTLTVVYTVELRGVPGAPGAPGELAVEPRRTTLRYALPDAQQVSIGPLTGPQIRLRTPLGAEGPWPR